MRKAILAIVAAIMIVTIGIGVNSASSAPDNKPPVTLPNQANAHANNFNPGGVRVVPAEEHTKATIIYDTKEDVKKGRK